jgi:long-chain acyl-CoA synthetase
VKQRIVAEIARLSSEFRGYERIRAVALLPEDFTQDNQMLTPSMKLKRRKVLERWGSVLEALYAEDAAARS